MVASAAQSRYGKCFHNLRNGDAGRFQHRLGLVFLAPGDRGGRILLEHAMIVVYAVAADPR